MRFVVDANIILSGLIADSTTRRLLVELPDDLVTPAYVHDEIEKHTDLVIDKSGLRQSQVDDLIDILFKRISIVPRAEILDYLPVAARAMRGIDPDDAIYIATALARDAQIWSDDADYSNQELVPVVTTSEMVAIFNQVER